VLTVTAAAEAHINLVGNEQTAVMPQGTGLTAYAEATRVGPYARIQGLAPVDVYPAAQELQLPVLASHAPGLQPGWQLKQALAPSGAHFPTALQSVR